MRRTLTWLVAFLLLLTPAWAQDDAPWQAAITGQIEAFRAGDGAAALEFAGAGFKRQFSDPELFVKAVEASGYGPIIASRTHSFGDMSRVSPTEVNQVVRLVGPDQGLYEAFYNVVDEPDVGWKVHGVALRKQAGIGI